MDDQLTNAKMSRRALLGGAGKKAAASVALAPLFRAAIVSCAMADETKPLNGVAGIDRVVVLPGRTYLRGWAGYGEPPKHVEQPPETSQAKITWSKRIRPRRSHPSPIRMRSSPPPPSPRPAPTS